MTTIATTTTTVAITPAATDDEIVADPIASDAGCAVPVLIAFAPPPVAEFPESDTADG